ncbi:MAG: CinA family nicotinamide mononucleotide deamidase-related protein [Chloroflexi bacterium]|nr:MAG: CinA family nicotinamide mononucleotide deamidase-related protein [Chloroflexota bacterium]
MVNAEIVTIGTEILLGEIVDTNSAYITRQLRDIGVNVYYLTTVGDNLDRIASAIRIALSRSDVVITTGGLGPTVDDMTRQAVANATDRDLEFRPDLLEEIRERFRQFGAQMSENNRVQAYIPAGSIPVHNRLGTAPCFIVENAEGTVISLPGVPREMKDLMQASVIPYLRERTGGKGIIKALVLRTAGIGESQVDARIADLETWSNPTVGLAAHTGQTDIRITARADSEAEADELIAKAEAIVRERVGDFIYATGQEPLEAAFVQLLRDKGLKLAVSYAGPEPELVAARFSYPDVLAAQSFDAGLDKLLARVGRSQTDTLDYGELSELEAHRLMEASGADVVIAFVTLDEGTGITAMTREKAHTRRYAFGGTNTEAPIWAGTWGISMAWRLVRRIEVTW